MSHGTGQISLNFFCILVSMVVLLFGGFWGEIDNEDLKSEKHACDIVCSLRLTTGIDRIRQLVFCNN